MVSKRFKTIALNTEYQTLMITKSTPPILEKFSRSTFFVCGVSHNDTLNDRVHSYVKSPFGNSSLAKYRNLRLLDLKQFRSTKTKKCFAKVIGAILSPVIQLPSLETILGLHCDNVIMELFKTPPPNIRQLELVHNKDCHDISSIAKLNLRSLDVRFDEQSGGDENLRLYSDVETDTCSITLSSSPCTGAPLLKFKTLSTLTVCNGGSFDSNILNKLSSFVSLKSLRLRGTEYKNKDIVKLTSLEKLVLMKTSITKSPSTILTTLSITNQRMIDLSDLKQLTKLELESVVLDPGERLTIRHLKALEGLKVFDTIVEDSDFREVSSTLRNLNIGGLKNLGFDYEYLKLLTNLRHLVIHDAMEGDEEYFKGLTGLEQVFGFSAKVMRHFHSSFRYYV